MRRGKVSACRVCESCFARCAVPACRECVCRASRGVWCLLCGACVPKVRVVLRAVCGARCVVRGVRCAVCGARCVVPAGPGPG